MLFRVWFSVNLKFNLCIQWSELFFVHKNFRWIIIFALLILKFSLNSNVNSGFVIITYYYYYSVKRICIVLAKRNKSYYHLVNISESNPYIFIIAISIQIYHFCNRIFTNIFDLLFISLLTVSFHFIFSVATSSIYIVCFLYKYE